MPTSTPEPLPLDQVVNPYASNVEVEETPEQTPETTPETSETSQETPETVEKDQKPPSRSELTERLTTTATELEKVKGEVGVYDQKYKDALAKQEELQQQVKDRDEAFVKARTPVYRWESDPEVAAPRKEIVALLTDTLVDMAPENAEPVRSDILQIVDAYGHHRSKGVEALQKFKGILIEKFGEDGAKVFNLARSIYPKHAAAVEAEQRNSITHFDRARNGFEKTRREVTERFTSIGRATPEQIKANPDDINSIISLALADDEEALKELDVIARRAADATAGLPPLPPDAPVELVTKYRAAERSRDQFMQSAYEKDVQLRALVPVLKKLSEENAVLRKRVTAAADGNRPEIKTETGKKPEKKSTVPKEGEFSEIENPYAR